MSYEIGSGVAPAESMFHASAPSARLEITQPGRVILREGLDVNACLKLLDAVKLTIGAALKEGNNYDGATIGVALRTLEQLERRLVAGK